MTEDELNQGLDNFFGALINHAKKEAHNHAVYQALIEMPKLFVRPTTFHFQFYNKLDSAIREAIKTVNLGGDCEYADIFLNYQFYEGHIRKLCTYFEGIGCCADKSKAIVSRYLNYLRTGELGGWEAGQKVLANHREITCYWLPKFGTQEQWYELIKGLYDFKYGNHEKYLLAYKALFEAGTAKYRKQPQESIA